MHTGALLLREAESRREAPPPLEGIPRRSLGTSEGSAPRLTSCILKEVGDLGLRLYNPGLLAWGLFQQDVLVEKFKFISGILLFSFYLFAEELGKGVLLTSSMQTASHLPELLHIQTNTVFSLPPNLSVIHIGKPGGQTVPDIDVSGLPDSDVVSRVHAQIWVQGSDRQIVDMGSANGTYINNVRLQPRNFYPLNLGARIGLGQGNKVTFLFQNKQTTVPNPNNPVGNSSNAGVPSNNPPASVINTNKEAEIQVTIITQLIGFVLMLAGLGFLSSSLVVGSVGFIYNIPLIGLSVIGVLTLTYGGSNRRLGWVFIAIGVAIAIGSGGILIVPMTLFSFLLATGSFSVGYQLFTSGKVFNLNPLAIKEVFGKRS
ncbi:FHA domain-containing protein [Scytonema sp. NUACC26]|uniref:FHA domain-containing protein n=1 Tax=Scytonema sp. NUACC26 TaxID=3140176 RepID=UPI0034DBEEB2